MRLRTSANPSTIASPTRAGDLLRRSGAGGMLTLCVALAWGFASPAAVAAQGKVSPVQAQASGAFWQDVADAPARRGAAKAAKAAVGNVNAVNPRSFHGATLDRAGLAALAAGAPLERSAAAAVTQLTIALPHPDGGYQRFAIVESPVMEAGLAAKHPEIKTFAGKGIDDPSASLRMDLSPLGLHASIRSPQGAWYVDPYIHLDDSLHASYHARDLPNPHGALREGLINEPQVVLARSFYHAGDALEVRAIGFAPGASVSINVHNPDSDAGPRQSVVALADQNGIVSVTLQADPSRNSGAYEVTASDGSNSSSASYHVVPDEAATNAASGTQLRTYRLALLTDPSYASYFGGAANVTAAKVSLINRVTQVYEDETSIRLMLINNNDALNLDTAAQMTGSNGPCGGAACFTASQATGCSSATLSRNRVVVGLLAGASNYDIGHIALGLNGGGIASLGVVGAGSKAQGCTGVPTPVGDYYAVDYVAHEMGHQFAGNHTFNGVTGSCSGGNRNPATSVEPGSGSSIMAYAGICGGDNLQPHSDAYWSQRSFDEIVAYTSSAESNINEVQMAALTGFANNGQQFQLRYNGADSAPIVRGTNFTTSGIKAAIQGIAGWPVGATVTVSTLGDNAFTITFGGALAANNVATLQLVNCSAGCSGYVGEITAGGQTSRRGAASASGNAAPLVSAPAGYTIPVRTPFALSGSASDADGDALSYMWEQNDAGAGSGTGLLSNNKLNGPLFRQFGVRAVVSEDDAIQYGSPGQNHASTNPTRVFPDLAQILANNTNAETGACPTPAATPTPAHIECYSEFLPTASYVGTAAGNANPAALNFRLTARDGRGGVNSAATTLVLAPNAGPFLVTWPNSAVVLDAGSTQTVTWSVANTNVAPVGTTDVKISLSTDGGASFPHVLAASTPNNGSKAVTLPLLASDKARIKVEAVGNVFFDLSNADFSIRLAGDLNADGAVNCADLAIVKAAMGKRSGQPGYDARADLNHDGVVDIRDLSAVAQKVAGAKSCN
ncbi:M12 family metallo-peptidase [Rugamonas rubra]|uniref:Metallo-peptidase family M12B Reprolysin-like n=1 Tax=Rugamonas rubra TaxID=758825 RepID=A0A1I4U7Y1_9BURK|nr:M12 family metallo-peptidase [Rugamonas rubra]SFM85072.1 Metallo-peptidase family M12B Reprolysin-like [Rugamonas rubra]